MTPITRMNPIFYKAAAEGNISSFKKDSLKQPLEALLTPNKNTVLHVFITTLETGKESTDQTNFVREILSLCPSLLCQVNVKDETPLHLAARYGHAHIVKVLIKHAKHAHHQGLGSGAEAVREMLRMVNREKNTALHEAVPFKHIEVIKLLIKDPEFSYSVNDAGETPLYIAVERDYPDLVLEILKAYKSPAYDGPLGRTALHAAIRRGNTVTIKAILENIGGAITKRADQEGWTPLHLAAYLDRFETAKLLLELDSEVAYMKDKEGRTALHIAAQRGNYRIMQTITSFCPDCCELVDNKGWNALHFALKGDSPDSAVNVILKNSSLSNILNEKNAEGNTPLHLQYSRYFEDVFKNLIDNHPRVDKMAFNKNNLTAYQAALKSTENLPTEKTWELCPELTLYPGRVFVDEDIVSKFIKDGKKDIQSMKEAGRKKYLDKASEAHLVVATLITTVAFAAAITMPGGFVGTGGDPHYAEGTAILKRHAAFKVFVITDAVSLVLSSSAVITHLLIPLLFKYSDETRYANFIKLAFVFIWMAMVAMVLTFITGAYAVLEHSLDLVVSTCVIGSCFFAIISFICVLYGKDLGLDLADKVMEFIYKKV